MNVTQGQQYRHYKGNTYTVLTVGRHSETYEDYVVYQGQYNDPTYGKNPIWVRSLKEFTDHVQLGDKSVLRFTLL